jgi:hypothetical protein
VAINTIAARPVLQTDVKWALYPKGAVSQRRFSLAAEGEQNCPTATFGNGFRETIEPLVQSLVAGDGLEDLGKASVFDAHIPILSGSPEAWNTASETASHPGRDTLRLWRTRDRESRNEGTGVNFCRSTVIRLRRYPDSHLVARRAGPSSFCDQRVTSSHATLTSHPVKSG